MKDNTNLLEINLDENKNPVLSIEKKLENFEILKIGKIKCYDHPSFCEGLDKYLSNHRQKWNLKDDEPIGFLIKGRQGYTGTYKTVVFYRIKDNLD